MQQKGFAHLLLLVLLVAGIAVGIYLVKNPTFFKPHASEDPATIAQGLPNGLISYWRLDEPSGGVIYDITGSNNGIATNTKSAPGKIGLARKFAAISDYIDLGNKIPDSADSITVSTWINPSNVPPTSDIYSTHLKTVIYKNGLWSLNLSEYNVPRFQLVFSGTSTFVGCNAKSSLSPDIWTHITGSYDRNNIKIYVNGILENSCPHNEATHIAPDAVNNHLWFAYGGNVGRVDNGLKGIIDEVGIWNRPLSDSEIRLLSTGVVPDGSYTPPLPPVTSKSANITADPASCSLNGAETCTSTISWSSKNAPDLKISVRESPGSVFAQAPSGSQAAPWIRASGATFDAYSGTELLASVNVKGTGDVAPSSPPNNCTVSANGSGDSCPADSYCKVAVCTQSIPGNCSGTCQSTSAKPHLKADLNPCVISSGTTCTSVISWDFPASTNVKITIKEAPGSLFASGSSGTQAAPWISPTGATFQAYVNDVLTEELYVRGISQPESPLPSGQYNIADINHDGHVDIFDYNLLVINYGI